MNKKLTIGIIVMNISLIIVSILQKIDSTKALPTEYTYYGISYSRYLTDYESTYIDHYHIESLFKRIAFISAIVLLVLLFTLIKNWKKLGIFIKLSSLFTMMFSIYNIYIYYLLRNDVYAGIDYGEQGYSVALHRQLHSIMRLDLENHAIYSIVWIALISLIVLTSLIALVRLVITNYKTVS